MEAAGVNDLPLTISDAEQSVWVKLFKTLLTVEDVENPEDFDWYGLRVKLNRRPRKVYFSYFYFGNRQRKKVGDMFTAHIQRAEHELITLVLYPDSEGTVKFLAKTTDEPFVDLVRFFAKASQ